MYRYSKKIFNDLLLNSGTVRIGTLHDFRSSKHEKGVSDSQEGKKTVSHSIDEATITSLDDEQSQADRIFGAINLTNKNSQIKVTNSSFIRNFDEPNCFVFCVSEIKSAEVMREFDSAETCVEIYDLEYFASTLTNALNKLKQVDYLGLHKVMYANKDETWNQINWGVNAALIKEPQFKGQHEFRFVWQPINKGDIKPIVFSDSKLIKAVRRVFV